MLSENVETLGGGEEGPEFVLASPGDDSDPSQVLLLPFLFHLHSNKPVLN